MEEPGLNRVIRAGYELLGLQTYFTAGPKEVRAWTVRAGATAPQAAGVIHTDFERGFIRAEVDRLRRLRRAQGRAGREGSRQAAPRRQGLRRARRRRDALPLQRLSVELGPATREDLPQLVALLGVLFSQEAELVPDDTKQTRALEKILSDESVGRIHVAREGGKVVAMASLIYGISTAEGGLAASFEDMVVLPGYRGKGIGTALLEYVVAEARKQGVLRLMLLTDRQNKRAQALYRKLGFVESTMKAMRLKL